MRTERLAAALAAIFLLGTLGGCASAPDPQPPAKEPAMGRYVEQELSFPEGLLWPHGLHVLSDGTVEVMMRRSSGGCAFYASPDGGATWAGQSPAWMEGLEEHDFYAYTRSANGSIAAIHAPQTDDAINPSLLTVDAEGHAQDREMPLDGLELDAFPQGCAYSDDGSLVLFSYLTVQAYDIETMTPGPVSTPSADGTPISDVRFWDGKLLVAVGDELISYDPDTIEETGRQSADGTFYDLLGTGQMFTGAILRYPLSPSPDALYYCNRAGIYRMSPGGEMTERVADGSLLMLSMPSMLCHSFAALPDGSFLVLYFQNQSHRLLRYVFDETVPTQPDTELSVYSLADSSTVRQAIGVFQQQNPSVRVRYTVAQDGAEGTPRSDLLRTLNTELLAGKGPDVLALDNLPVESYEHKGVLLDLGSVVEERTGSGQWSAKAVAMKREGGGIYAVPARFRVPFSLAEPDAAGKDLSGMAAWLEERHAADPSLYENWFSPHAARPLMREYFEACYPAWFAADGSVNEEAVSSFLSDIEAIRDVAYRPNEDDQEYDERYRNSLEYGSIGWARLRDRPVSIATLSNMDGLAVLLAAYHDREGEIEPLKGQVEGVYIPLCLLGVNAQSPRAQLGQAFVETALSETVQAVNLDDGLPVNRMAMEQLALEPGGEGTYDYKYGWNSEDGGVEIYEVFWPEKADLDKMFGMIDSLTLAVPEDEELFGIITDESEAFFGGNRSLEDTVASISGKLQLRRSEAGQGE